MMVANASNSPVSCMVGARPRLMATLPSNLRPETLDSSAGPKNGKSCRSFRQLCAVLGPAMCWQALSGFLHLLVDSIRAL